MKAKKFFVRLVLVLIVLAIGFGIHVLVNKLTGPRDVKLVPGWQCVQINGIVPKGTVLIVSSKANTVLPNLNPETRQSTGYINQGRVNFYKSAWLITATKVWAYYPSQDYEFLEKRNNFATECQQKLSELTEGEGTLFDEYDVGHK